MMPAQGSLRCRWKRNTSVTESQPERAFPPNSRCDLSPGGRKTVAEDWSAKLGWGLAPFAWKEDKRGAGGTGGACLEPLPRLARHPTVPSGAASQERGPARGSELPTGSGGRR
jgi:hypothetical protein